jgi:hypothetical protein
MKGGCRKAGGILYLRWHGLHPRPKLKTSKSSSSNLKIKNLQKFLASGVKPLYLVKRFLSSLRRKLTDTSNGAGCRNFRKMHLLEKNT